MDARHRILLLDDDPDLLDMYREILAQLPSKPLIRTASSGARALAMLEADPYRLLICDLKMPKMDGLQVLSIVRRKFPELRTVALTSVLDEQFRSRAYALGVDLFWNKPGTEQEIQMFLECLESLLGPDAQPGFRGLQSKSLVDIVQLECMSMSSSVLRISNGVFTGRIWIQNGELIDAEAGGLKAEEAFLNILTWKAGHFETLPPDPARPRSIHKSYNALLLESVQALDESRGQTADPQSDPAASSSLARISQVEGIEFLLGLKNGQDQPHVARGLEDPERMAAWARQTLTAFRALGERLWAGPFEELDGLGPQRHVALASQGGMDFCLGWRHSMAAPQVREMTRKVLALWDS